jgi:hypothetical protein
MADFKGEKLEKKLADRNVFFYHDTANKIKQISSEVYKKNDLLVHYPRGFEGGQKYKYIKKISYKGFKGKLPVGAIKSVNFGWGFTKTLNPFAYYIDETYKITEVVVEKGGKTQLDKAKHKLLLSEKDLSFLQDSFSSTFQTNKAQVNLVLQNNLHKLFPTIVAKPKKTYVKNALATSISSWGNSISEFSDDDKSAIKDLFEKLSIGTDFLSKSTLTKTKEIIDNKYIQDTLKKFWALMKLTTSTTSVEKKWQAFLKSNSWIFSTIFAQPVILYKDEAYVGGKTIDNKNGKFNDFLIKNSLSDNVSFLEIKTHKTPLLEKSKYRGEDVYCAAKDMTGSIAQVLNQRDNFQKEFYLIKTKSFDKGNIETFNSKCVVLIGSTKSLKKSELYSFELFRSNSRDVEVITFDELQVKIESLQKILKQ